MARVSAISPNLINVQGKSQKSSPAAKSESSSKTSSPNSDHLELIRRKYIIQNRSLAKNNSLSMTKISNLESKVSELINENMALRKKNSMKEMENKQWLHEKLALIEGGVASKFDEIFQIFKNLREAEGLPENSFSKLLGGTLDASRSRRTTIYKSSNEDDNISTTRRKSSRRHSMLIDPERDPDINYKNGVEVSPLARTPRSQGNEYNEGDSKLMEEVDLDMDISSMEDAYNDIIEPSSEDEGLEADIIENSIPESEEEEQHPTTDGSKFTLSSEFEPILCNETAHDKLLADCTNITELEVTSFPEKTLTEETEQEYIQVKPNEVETSRSPVKKSNNRKTKHSTSQKGTKSSPKSIEAMPLSQNTHSNSKIDKVNISDSSSTTDSTITNAGRRSRNRKSINYALPSLRKKMRRDSEKFVDAVVSGDVEIVDFRNIENSDGFFGEVDVKKEDTASTTDNEVNWVKENGKIEHSEATVDKTHHKEVSESQSLKSIAIPEKKRRKLEDKASSNKLKERKPLGNVTSSNRNKLNKGRKEIGKKESNEVNITKDLIEKGSKGNETENVEQSENVREDTQISKSNKELIEDSLEKMRAQSLIELNDQEKDESVADLSIFDFVDESSKSDIIKTFKKHSSKREKRRHSMLI